MRFSPTPALRKSKAHSRGLAAHRAERPRTARHLAIEPLEGRQLLSAGGWVANSMATPGSGDPGFAIALGADGFTYVAGTYQGTQQFGGTTLTSVSGDRDLFVTKVDSDGQFVWAVSAGGTGDDASVPERLLVDSAENLYLVSEFEGTANFGGITLTSEGARNVVVARLNGADGAFQWATRLGRDSRDSGLGLDSQGRLTVGGSFQGTGSFGPFQLTSQGTSDGFLARLVSATGDVDWVRQLPPDLGEGDLAVNSGGDIYLTSGLVLQKFNSDGLPQWTQPIRYGESAVAVHEQGGSTYIYTQDVFNGLNGQRKFQDMGTSAQEVWARQLDPRHGTTDFYWGIAVDAFSNTYALGKDSFGRILWKLDADGNTLSLQHTTGPETLGEEAFSHDVEVDPAGNLYTTGYFYLSNQLFDTGAALVPPSSPTNGQSMYLLKTTQDRATIYGRAFNDLNNDGVWQFQDLDGNGYWSGNDTGEPSLPGAKVYLDDNQNSQWDPVDPWTTTGVGGEYLLRHVVPGAHTVRLVSLPGFAPSDGFVNGVSIVAEAGESNLDIDLAAHTATTWRTYTSSDVPKNFPRRRWQEADSLLAITDVYRAFGVEATVSLTVPRQVTLYSPDGSGKTIGMPAGQTTITVYGNEFNQKPVAGTWKLLLQGSDVAPASTLTAWSLRILGPTNPPPSPGFAVSPVSGLVTNEDLATASFTVALKTQPTADVTIAISSSDTTEGTVNASSLTFTSANWNQPQTVTVTGVNDLVIDGNINYTVNTGAAVSGDPDYAGIDPANVAVANNDNDRKGKIKLEADAMGHEPPLAPLDPGALTSIAAAAHLRWAATGADLSRIAPFEILVANLPGKTLGETDDTTIWVDADAAGWGWFVDPTPLDDREFTTPGAGRMDLLTVVMHEMGHLLGLGHDEHGVMAETLAAGVRRTGLEHDHVARVDQVLQQARDPHDFAWLGAWLNEQFDPAYGRAQRRGSGNGLRPIEGSELLSNTTHIVGYHPDFMTRRIHRAPRERHGVAFHGAVGFAQSDGSRHVSTELSKSGRTPEASA